MCPKLKKIKDKVFKFLIFLTSWAWAHLIRCCRSIAQGKERQGKARHISLDVADYKARHI